MNTLLFIAIVAAAAVIAALITFLIAKSSFNSKLSAVSSQLDAANGDIDRLSGDVTRRDIKIAGLEKDVEYKQREMELLKENYEKTLKQEVDAFKAEFTAESEKILTAREEEISKKAEESFKAITGDFNKTLADMKAAFEANKKTQSETSAELRTQIGEAVKNLKEKSEDVGKKAEDVGKKADHLANALRGQNKMQGCWGETQLENLLLDEGLTEGRDFDKEETLRDELGIVIHNEDTGKRMRPDFILHNPDGTDIVVDCKVSLNALVDYSNAKDDKEREEAAGRNLKAVKAQVENLSKKDYSSYLKPGRKCLDYTIMYVPNVNALILARKKDPKLLADAFQKNVLITSEETLMPFLRLVRSAWRNFDQARNQEKIISAATTIVDRVALFCENYANVGKKLNDAVEAYNKGDNQLRESGKSIVHAAREVEALGVKGKNKKALPPMIDEFVIADTLPEETPDEQ